MSTGSAYKEGTTLASLGSNNLNRSYERKPGGSTGNGTDTDNNSSDFQLISPSNPQNLSSNCISGGNNLSINDVSTNEGNSGTTSITFTISLSSPAGIGGVSFDIATADGTATVVNNDYIAKSLTSQTILAGATTSTFTVDVNGDVVTEANETFFVNVTNVTGATISDGQGQGTIVNDDASDTAPTVSSTNPDGNATDVLLTSDVSVTFSEPVNVSGNWFQLACPISGTRGSADAAVTGGPTTFTINPNADFANSETCALTVYAANVTDQDASDPPDAMAVDYVTSFTMIGPDNAPAVASTIPADGATNVPLNQSVIGQLYRAGQCDRSLVLVDLCHQRCSSSCCDRRSHVLYPQSHHRLCLRRAVHPGHRCKQDCRSGQQ